MPAHKKHTLFQAAPSPPTNQSLQECMFFATQVRNSNIFSPTLRCFNFFANSQPTTDKQSDSLLQALTGQSNVIRTLEARTANKGLNESGGTVLRWTVFRIFELWCFVVSAVLKCPAFVKPLTVIGHFKRQTLQ